MNELDFSTLTVEQAIELIKSLQDFLAGSMVPRKQLEPSAKAIEKAKQMGPMDDLFFNKLAEEKAAIGEVISTILNIKVDVVDVIPQNTITSLQNRGVRLDSLSRVVPQALVKVKLDEDSPIGPKGAFVDMEVQKENKDDHQFRVYYNGAAVILNETPKGTQFKDLPRVVVIYISSFDVFGGGRMLYETELLTKQGKLQVRRPVKEFYVNMANKEIETDHLMRVAELMDLFRDRDTFDYDKFPNFSKRKHQLEYTEEGIKAMASDIEKMLKEEYGEAERNTLVNAIKNLMKNLKLTVEQAMDALSIPQNDRATYISMIGQ